jgi:uncharacterized Fe-S center protein
MVEHAYGVAKTKPGSAFYISFLMNIVPLCDCVNFSGAPVVPDIGFAASTDPVALDACCLDMVNQQIGLVGSALKEAHEPGKSKFCDLHPDLKTELQLEYAEKIGLGTRKYERINLEQ